MNLGIRIFSAVLFLDCQLPLRAAIKKASEENEAVRREGVRVIQNGGTRTVNFEVVPLSRGVEAKAREVVERARREERRKRGRPKK